MKAGLQLPSLTGSWPFFGNQRINDIFSVASNHIDTTFQYTPVIDAVFNDELDAFNNAVNGKTTLVKALDKVQADTVALMKQQGFSVIQ